MTLESEMQAIVCNEYGSPDVLQVHFVDQPQPKDDEVLVKVHAVGVNPWDIDMLYGRPFVRLTK